MYLTNAPGVNSHLCSLATWWPQGLWQVLLLSKDLPWLYSAITDLDNLVCDSSPLERVLELPILGGLWRNLLPYRVCSFSSSWRPVPILLTAAPSPHRGKFSQSHWAWGTHPTAVPFCWPQNSSWAMGLPAARSHPHLVCLSTAWLMPQLQARNSFSWLKVADLWQAALAKFLSP